MIDRSLNYGRQLIEGFISDANYNQVVLDLGAGCGNDLLSVRKVNPKVNLFAVEIDREFIETLKKNDIIVYPLDIEKDRLPFIDNSVDIIIANQVMEHTKNIFWIFHEISRVLRVGGILILGIPNLASLHNRILLLCGIQPTSIKTYSAHVRGFTKGDILTFLNKCFPYGYFLKRFGGSNFYPFPPDIAKVMAHLFPTLAWSIFFMLEKKKIYNDSLFLTFPVINNLQSNFFLGTIMDTKNRFISDQECQIESH